MISPITETDFLPILAIAETAVRECVATCESEAQFIIQDVLESLENWWPSRSQSFHASYCLDRTVGFIVVQNYWNLSHLFVLPEFHRRGIGRCLLHAALDHCRSRSPYDCVRLNSSRHAAPFYASMGFTPFAPARDLPGGCIPLQFNF